MSHSHSHVDPHNKDSIRITWMGLFLNILLGVGKCIIGYIGHSKALLADGLHSFVDLSTDIITLVGIKVAFLPKDENHPYGHHKFTSLGSLFMSALLMIFCGGLIWNSVQNLIVGDDDIPEMMVFWAALASLLIKEYLFWRTRAIALKSRSSLLMSNAWHHRGDAVTSLLVIISVLAIRWLGPSWGFLDSAVGILMGAYIAIETGKLFINACKDLLDTAPHEQLRQELSKHIMYSTGVCSFHNFRARSIGDFIEVDVHVRVDPSLSVVEGHNIAHKVKEAIMHSHEEVSDVLVHIEPGKKP